MSAASKAFIADAKAFMKTNIVLADLVDPPIDNSGNQSFDLVPDGDGFNSAGKKIPKYKLARAKAATTDPIKAFWLANVQGTTVEKTLVTDNRFFFTAGLSGCAFAVGDGPTPQVKHIDHEVGQKPLQIITDSANKDFDLYTEENYGSDKEGLSGRATVFGIKTGTAWEFWAQAFFVDGKVQYKLRFSEGIMPIQI